MAVDSKRPEYIDHMDEWSQLRDTARGVVAVKRAGSRYLPMPSAFTAQADDGRAMYAAYQKRARFPDILDPTIAGMVGVIHRNESAIQMPAVMEPLWESCTLDHLPLEAFHRRITTEILLMGRFSILTDAPVDGSDLPYFAGYTTETLINWADDLTFFDFDETSMRMDPNTFDWTEEKAWRVLRLKGGVYTQELYGQDTERTGILMPTARGGAPLDQIPVVVVGPTELSVNVADSPLQGVSDASVTLYQLDADYRWQLYMSGQETLFVIGADQLPTVVGASVVHGLPLNGDAKYVGPSGSGIAAHRQAMLDAKEDAIIAGAALFESPTGRESGEALKLRYSAQTATLTTVALASAQALERSLRNVALFLGLNPAEVIVIPNLRFIDSKMTPAEGVQLMQMWTGNAISKQTMYENLQKGELASQERNFEDEQKLIEAEQAEGITTDPAAEKEAANQNALDLIEASAAAKAKANGGTPAKGKGAKA